MAAFFFTFAAKKKICGMFRKIIPVSLLLRLSSPASAFLLVVVCLVRFGLDGLSWTVAAAMSAAAVALDLYPASYETIRMSVAFNLFSELVIIVYALFPDSSLSVFAAVSAIGGVSVFVYSIIRLIDKFSRIKILFRNENVWSGIEDSYRMLTRMSIPLIGVVYLFVMPRTIFWLWSCPVVLAGVVTVLTYTCWTGRVLLMSRRTENTIRNVVRFNSQMMDRGEAITPEDDLKMSALYSRVVSYMDSRKPYLSDGFGLDDMANAVFTNRVYLSRTINYYSGRNFKQFVNYYRVMYAVELIKRDPRLNVLELASMSGFHSVVTFNMAFRLNMDSTPGAFSKDEIAKRK